MKSVHRLDESEGMDLDQFNKMLHLRRELCRVMHIIYNNILKETNKYKTPPSAQLAVQALDTIKEGLCF